MTLGPANCPKILVGLKADLREEYEKDPSKADQCISTEEGMKVKDEYNFQHYIECSAMTRFRLTDVFYRAVQTHFHIQWIKVKPNVEGDNGGNQFPNNPKPTKPGGWCSVL